MCLIELSGDYGDCSAQASDWQNWPRRWEKVTDMNKDNEHNHDIHTYEYSGIQERTGKVNTWLLIVYAALLIWGVWYLITFWKHA